MEVSEKEFLAVLAGSIELDKPLAPFSGYKTGGTAKFFISVKSVDDLSQIIKVAKQYNIPYFILGGGTNILISDSGFNGLIVKVDIKGMVVKDKTIISCGAGEDLEGLVEFTAENSLSGIEFAAGIVGSVGGAVYGNAGAYGGEIGNIVQTVTVVTPDGAIKNLNSQDIKFDYRDSIFKRSKDIICIVEICLNIGKKEDIKQKIDEIVAVRYEKLPYEECSAGCFFKNIPDKSQIHGKLAAGKLLEEIGAKQMSIGGAKVSQKHANIIINDGTACSNDIFQLAEKLKMKVKEKYGIILQEEVIKIGNFN